MAENAGENSYSRRGWWLWLLYAFVIWQFATTAFWAFHGPWTWTTNQIVFVFYTVAIIVGLGSWLFIWWRGGSQAVKERWARMRRAPAISKRAFTWNLLLWVVIALALVLLFNWLQLRGHA